MSKLIVLRSIQRSGIDFVCHRIFIPGPGLYWFDEVNVGIGRGVCPFSV